MTASARPETCPIDFDRVIFLERKIVNVKDFFEAVQRREPRPTRLDRQLQRGLSRRDHREKGR